MYMLPDCICTVEGDKERGILHVFIRNGKYNFLRTPLF